MCVVFFYPIFVIFQTLLYFLFMFYNYTVDCNYSAVEYINTNIAFITAVAGYRHWYKYELTADTMNRPCKRAMGCLRLWRFYQTFVQIRSRCVRLSDPGQCAINTPSQDTPQLNPQHTQYIAHRRFGQPSDCTEAARPPPLAGQCVCPLGREP